MAQGSAHIFMGVVAMKLSMLNIHEIKQKRPNKVSSSKGNMKQSMLVVCIPPLLARHSTLKYFWHTLFYFSILES